VFEETVRGHATVWRNFSCACALATEGSLLPGCDAGTLTGTVTTAAAGVPPTVVVAAAAGFSFSATTGEGEVFTFERLPAGRATLQADVIGSIGREPLDDDVTGSAVTTVTLPLNGRGAIDGHRSMDRALAPQRRLEMALPPESV
jgi:hypothetical protein